MMDQFLIDCLLIYGVLIMAYTAHRETLDG
jgi:hypothetical protein